ncbi:hypothetical protein ACN08Y_09950 [Rothia sp. P5764]|uniref:hypothetical protein n=1 Tax=Rothia sp. P5764 TaxID=3402654 RepID=UPI003AC12C2F
MVEAEFTLEHPLKYSKKSAFWWLATYAIEIACTVAAMYFAAQSTPWDNDMPESSGVYMLLVVASFLLSRVLTDLTWKQVRYHTAGYMAEFSIFDKVTGPGSAFNYLAWFTVDLATVAAFYAFNPSNFTYSSLATAIAIALFVKNMASLAKLIYRAARTRNLDYKEYTLRYRLLGAKLLVITSLYLAFPAYAEVPPEAGMVVILLGCMAIARIVFWGMGEVVRAVRG